MPINQKLKDRYELYDKILKKIAELTVDNPTTLSELYNSLYSIQALNNMEKILSELIVMDKDQPGETSMKFILHHFKTLDLILYDSEFNNIIITAQGIIKSTETFTQEYSDKVEKHDLEIKLLNNQVITNRRLVKFNKYLVILTILNFLLAVFSFLKVSAS